MSGETTAIAAALKAYNRGIVEGDPAGDEWIAANLIKPAWGETEAVKYLHRQSSHQYCADFVAYCWRKGGLTSQFNLGSVGRIKYNFADYQHEQWCVVLHAGGPQIWELEQYHDDNRARRQICMPRLAKPGDALLHQNPERKWHGHAMLVVASGGGFITVYEGNSTRSMGPSGKYHEGTLGCDMTRRAGIGTRTFSVDDPYLDCAVRPSLMDYCTQVAVFSSKDEAEAFAERRYP